MEFVMHRYVLGPAICKSCRGFVWAFRKRDTHDYEWSHSKTHKLRCPAIQWP